jgi:phosphate transport system permease protein
MRADERDALQAVAADNAEWQAAINAIYADSADKQRYIGPNATLPVPEPFTYVGERLSIQFDTRANPPGLMLTWQGNLSDDDERQLREMSANPSWVTWVAALAEDSEIRDLPDWGFLRSHRLDAGDAPVVQILPSYRNKTIFTKLETGKIVLLYVTSGERVATIEPVNGDRFIAYQVSAANKGVFAITDTNHVEPWLLDASHIDVNATALFLPVHYEGRAEPDLIWQSTPVPGVEPKFSLIPLIFGTLKATFYAMIFAVPLAILGALYTSQFLHPTLQRVVKPTVEIMAAVPSVVVGYLAGAWFAPIAHEAIPGIFATVIFLPVGVILFFIAYQFVVVNLMGRRIEKQSAGYEFLLLVPGVIFSILIAVFLLGPVFEGLFFNGNFLQTMQDGGVQIEQRNSIVIAVALGFAVIPIIFTITDDSLSNVPKSLSAASLAVGASRWQTAWRVILPSASPGIFAASMIGLGRAIGETMIVLMSTGNTAILDFSPFNGMRTLSANIAVEVPEAPVGGTLYRILFLSATILFVMTFVINTTAELVRLRLRKKYAQFQ